MATLYLQAKVDSTDYGDVGSGPIAPTFLRLVSFGAYASDTAAFDIRNIKVGTSGYGSSDLFAPTLADLTEFDGVFGNDGSIVAAAGVLSVDAATAGDHYGWKNLGVDITTDLYVQFELRVRTGNGEPDYHDVWADATFAAADGTPVDGLFSGASIGTDSWLWDGPGDPFGTAPPTGTYVTVNLHYSFTAPSLPATITLTPADGSAGSTDSISGAHFSASTSITATFDGSPVSLSGTTSTDGSGNFSGATYTVPALADGTYTVAVSDGTSTATATFTIGTAPSNGTQDTAITVSGCSGMTISNQFAATTAAGSDPLNTVYAFGGTFSRQVWYSITNTSTIPAYGRFVLTNNGASGVDVAAAVYTDNPAANPLFDERASSSPIDHTSSWQIPLAPTFSIRLGQLLAPGQTLWLEVAGDDTEGDGQGWDGPLGLQWELDTATTYDALGQWFGDTRVPTASYAATETASIQDPLSYCKLGDLHFAAFTTVTAHEAQVLVWTEGGTSTAYPIGPDYTAYGSPNPGADFQIGPSQPLLRTDGENVWLIVYVELEGAIQCRPGNCDPPVPFHTTISWAPAVYVWNGGGFTNLGTAGGDTFSIFSYKHAVGQLTAAASPAEPGVVHVVWSEAGATEIYLCEDDAGFSGGGCTLRTYRERVVYARWSATGVEVSDVEVFGDGGSDPATISHYLSGEQLVTNAFGSPVFFYSKPTDFNIISGGVTYGSEIEMYALDSGGVPTVLQTVDISTLPGFSGDVLWGDVGNRIGGTQQQQSAYQGVDTIFLGTGVSPAANTSIILSVPADGSGPITLFSTGTDTNQIPSESYTDGTNVWLSFPGNGGNIEGYPDCAEPPHPAGYQFDVGATKPCVSYAGGIENRGMELFHDSGSDSLYTFGWNCDHSSAEFAPLKIPILRDFFACTVGTCASTGLNIWQRL